MKQKTWEIWFILSCFALSSLIFIGILDGSKQFFTDWPYYMLGAVINMLSCIYVGVKAPSEDDEDE